MLKSQKLLQEIGAKTEALENLTSGSSEHTNMSVEIASLSMKYSKAVQEEAEQRTGLTGDAEDLEKQSLLRRASVGDFVKALLDRKSVAGASAEARSAFGCTGEYEIPLQLFDPLDKTKAATPAPGAGNRPVAMAPSLPFAYQRTVAGFLGIDMPMVSGGEQGYPVLTTNAPADPKGKGDAADATAAAITVHKSNVKKITGAYTVRVEDQALFPQLEETLRMDIPRSIANTLDQQLLAGDGNAPNLKSLISLLNNPAADMDAETFATFISTITGQVDGLHAYELADLFALVGMKTYEVMTGTFAVNTAVSSADYLHDKIGGLRASNRFAVPAGDDQQAIVRLGMEPMVAVAPVWGGIQLVDDVYTGALKGERTITAYQLVSDVLLLRAAAFKQIDFHLA